MAIDYTSLALRVVKSLIDLYLAYQFISCFLFFIQQKRLALIRDYEDPSFTQFNKLIIGITGFLFLLTLLHVGIGLLEPIIFLFDLTSNLTYRACFVFTVVILVPVKDFFIFVMLCYLFWFQGRKKRDSVIK
jgi:hypothetical protein